MDWNSLETAIAGRFYRCNELTMKQSEDYASIAVNQMKRHMGILGSAVIVPLPNPAMSGVTNQSLLREAKDDAQ